MFKIRNVICTLFVCSSFINAYSQNLSSTSTLKVTGDFTGSTCKVTTNVNGADSALTITIPPVTDTELNQTDGFSPVASNARTFSIAVSECQGSYRVNVFFDVSSNLVDGRGYLKNTTTSGGSSAVLQILNEFNTAVVLTSGSNQGINTQTYTNVQTGYESKRINTGERVEFPFKVRYSRPENGNATPGKVTAVLPFYLNYQ